MPRTHDTPYWAGGDQVVLDEVSKYGLRTLHIMRRSGPPDVDAWKQAYPQAYGTSYEGKDGNWHLWLWWKEQKGTAASR